jgi:aldehyde:ferredoxin oxidoreductase
MIFRFHPKDPTAHEDQLPPIIAKDFIVVTVFGIRDFFDNLKTGTSLSGPDHKSSFSFGLFSGTTFQSASRKAVGAKSPSTNIIESDLPLADFPPREKLKDLALEYAAEP